MRFKNILLVYKLSSLQYLKKKGDFTKQLKKHPHFDKRFKRTHIRHYETLQKIEQYLKKKNIPFKKLWRGKTFDFKPFDMIITVGGDGTFLDAARQVEQQTMAGINSDPIWSVGRLCIANSHNYIRILDRIFSGHYKIIRLHRLKLKFAASKYDHLFLNDILITNKNPAAMSRYLIGYKKKREEHRSSGLWVSTAVGSTSAVHSAGGKILPFKSQNWQYRPREMYGQWHKKYSLTGSIIRPPERILVQSLMKDGFIYIDGSHRKIPFPFGEKVFITNSNHPIKFLTI